MQDRSAGTVLEEGLRWRQPTQFALFPSASQYLYSSVGCFLPNSLLLGVPNSFLRPFCHCWCPPFSAGHAEFLFICLPGDFFTFVSQVRCLRCWCPPFSAGHAVSGSLLCDFFTCASQVQCLYCWCPSFSADHAALFPKQFTVRGSQFFLKMCPPFVSMVVSALFRWWPCSIAIHLSPRSVAAGVLPFPLAFLRACLPGLSLVVPPCSISIHLSPRSVTGVRPFPRAMQNFCSFCFPGLSLVLATQHFYSCVSQVCHWWCPSISAGDIAFLFVGHVAYLRLSFRSVAARVRPFPLASHAACLFICLPGLSLSMSFYSFASQACRCFICLPGLSLVVSTLFRWPCSISIHLASRSVAM